MPWNVVFASRYERHRPEPTLLFQIIDQHYPAFMEQLTARGRSLPGYVQLLGALN